MLGSKVQYGRQKYSGEVLAYGLLDDEREDDFGTRRKSVGARRERPAAMAAQAVSAA